MIPFIHTPLWNRPEYFVDNLVPSLPSVENVDNPYTYFHLSTGFSKMDFLCILGQIRVFHKPTAPTTATTDRMLFYISIHVNKGVVHNHETDMQQRSASAVHQYC